MKQKNLNELLGFDQYKIKFADIRNTIEREYTDRIGKIHADLDNIITTNNSWTEKSAPNLILYN